MVSLKILDCLAQIALVHPNRPLLEWTLAFFLIWKEDKEKRVQFLENVRFTMGLLDMVHVGITYLLFV